jgi:hypothetical protein
LWSISLIALLTLWRLWVFNGKNQIHIQSHQAFLNYRKLRERSLLDITIESGLTWKASNKRGHFKLFELNDLINYGVWDLIKTGFGLSKNIMTKGMIIPV